jgi:hypothetical protein
MRPRPAQSEPSDRSIRERLWESEVSATASKKGPLCDFQKPEPASRARSCPEARSHVLPSRCSRRQDDTKTRSGWRREDANNLTPNPFPSGKGDRNGKSRCSVCQDPNQARTPPGCSSHRRSFAATYHGATSRTWTPTRVGGRPSFATARAPSIDWTASDVPKIRPAIIVNRIFSPRRSPARPSRATPRNQPRRAPFRAPFRVTPLLLPQRPPFPRSAPGRSTSL